MALDFTKLVGQVTQMGQSMANHTLSLAERVELAREHFMALPDNRTILERVKLARIKDAGYRGAAPLNADSEPLNTIVAPPELPARATILAADGSQIYPDHHSAAFYFVTNVGIFTYFHGEDRLPTQFTDPQMFYRIEDTHDYQGNPIKNAVVNARRTVREMQLLAEKTWDLRHIADPIIALYDGPLLFFLGKDVVDAAKLEQDYDRALIRLYDTHHTMDVNETGGRVSLVGYVDRPTSRFGIALLSLLLLDERDVTRTNLDTMGPYEGLTDSWLLRELLPPGHRSALMVQQSPQNKRFRNEIGDDFEIAFFYLNVSPDQSYIARIEMPMWVAQKPQMVDEIHALALAQCDIMGNYPYALTRADELAVIRSAEKQALEDMIRTELLRHNQAFEDSAKLIGKHQTRAIRRRYGDHIKPAF